VEEQGWPLPCQCPPPSVNTQRRRKTLALRPLNRVEVCRDRDARSKGTSSCGDDITPSETRLPAKCSGISTSFGTALLAADCQRAWAWHTRLFASQLKHSGHPRTSGLTHGNVTPARSVGSSACSLSRTCRRDGESANAAQRSTPSSMRWHRSQMKSKNHSSSQHAHLIRTGMWSM
jgi:hypothetical protein